MNPTVTIGYLPILDHLILGVAQKNDPEAFARLGLKTKQFSDWDTLANALKDGDIDGAFLLSPLAMDIFRSGVPIETLLLGHREGQTLIVSDAIANAKDLQGKTVLLPHPFSTHHILLYKILKNAGLALADVNIEFVKKDLRLSTERLAKGDVDAMFVAEPMVTDAVRRKVGHALQMSHEIEAHHIDCVFVLRKDAIGMEQKNVLVQSLVNAGMFVNAYPRQAAEIGEGFLGWQKKLLLEAMSHDRGHILFWDLLPRVEDFVALQDIAVDEMKLWNTKIDLRPFVSHACAQEAYREWTIGMRQQVKDRGSERTLPGNFKEAAARFQAFWGDPISLAGLVLVRPGEKYPKEIERVREVKELYSVFLEKVFAGSEFVVGSMTGKTKAFGFLHPANLNEPDRVIIRLSIVQAESCLRALHFGDAGGIFQPYSDATAERDVISPGKAIVFLERKNEVWASLSYHAFKFLVLLLSNVDI